MHVIMKFPEGFNEEEYPKFNVAHCYAYIVFVGAVSVAKLIWLVVVPGTVDLVSDIRMLQMK